MPKNQGMQKKVILKSDTRMRFSYLETKMVVLSFISRLTTISWFYRLETAKQCLKAFLFKNEKLVVFHNHKIRIIFNSFWKFNR